MDGPGPETKLGRRFPLVCPVQVFTTLLKPTKDDTSMSFKQNDTEAKQYPKDITTLAIGDFGKWQLYISIMMTMLKLPIAWYQLNIIFMAPPQDFWCEKPNIFRKYSDEEWRRICAPLVEEHPCFIYDPKLLIIYPPLSKTMIPLVPCPKFLYNRTVFSRTITSDWDLVCPKHWIIHLTQCVMMWGIMIGGIIFGVLADKYGRRMPLIICLVIQGAFSYICSLVPWYSLFIISWLILALASGGIGIISFVVCMEVVSGKWRTIIPVLYQLPFGLGSAAMAGLAYWLRDWRKLEFGLATFSSLYILYWLWLPESPRWLIATGRYDQAIEVLKDAARMNGREFNSADMRSLMDGLKARNKEPGFMAFLKSKNLRMKTILLSLNWFCTGLAFYTFSQFLGYIGGNIFMAVAWTGIISILGGFSCIFLITRVGRKTTAGIYQLITALCFLFILLVPKDDTANEWPRLLFAGIGFAGMAGTIPALYLFSGELFPTLGRNVGVSGVTLFARIASMIAPAVVSLDTIIADLPMMILAVTSILQILMLLPLPETKDRPLPDTLAEAEKL